MASSVFNCVLQKNSVENSFGFTVQNQPGTPHIFISNVKENSPAWRAGLKQGDLLVQMEGETVFGKTVKAVSEIIGRAKDGRLKIVFSRMVPYPPPSFSPPPHGAGIYRPDLSSWAPSSYQPGNLHPTVPVPARPPPPVVKPPPEEPQPHPFSIHHLKKWQNGAGFGFTILSQQDGSKIISEVKPNTPASASGIPLKSVVCQVNSTNVLTMDYEEVVKLIKESGSTVSITVTSIKTVGWLQRTGKTLEVSMPKLQIKTQQAPADPQEAAKPPQQNAHASNSTKDDQQPTKEATAKPPEPNNARNEQPRENTVPGAITIRIENNAGSSPSSFPHLSRKKQGHLAVPKWENEISDGSDEEVIRSPSGRRKSVNRITIDSQKKFLEFLDKMGARVYKIRMGYEAKEHTELSVFPGEIVELIDDDEAEIARNDNPMVHIRVANGRAGYVPKANVTPLRSAPSTKPPAKGAERQVSVKRQTSEMTLSKRKTNYIDIEKIGSGSYGDATLATRITDGKQVVIKEIELDGVNDDKIRTEAIILAKYQHIRIVKFMGYFEENRKLYIETKYCSGGNLWKAIQKKSKEPNGKFDETEIQKWTLQLVSALEHLHDLGIIHRDVKAENVFLTDESDVKLGDMGSAAEVSRTLKQMRGTFVGTMSYMAPEIFSGLPYDTQVDIWSLGVLVYYLAALQLPFGNELTVFPRVMSRNPPAPLPTWCSQDLVQFVDSLLTYEPTLRPNIKDVLEECFLKRKPQTNGGAADKEVKEEMTEEEGQL